MYNGSDTPPYANDDGNDDLRVYKSRAGHTVTFDDTSGSENVDLVTNSEAVTSNMDDPGGTLESAADQDVKCEAGSLIELKCTDLKVEASSSVDISAGSSANYTASASATVDGGASLSASAGTVSIN